MYFSTLKFSAHSKNKCKIQLQRASKIHSSSKNTALSLSHSALKGEAGFQQRLSASGSEILRRKAFNTN